MAAAYVEGWRFWRYTRDEGRGRVLASATRGKVWPPGLPVRALCPWGLSPPCTRGGCMCGLHAYWCRRDAERDARRWAHATGCVYAVGRIAGYGRVARHELGFRAEHALIIEITAVTSGGLILAAKLDRLYR